MYWSARTECSTKQGASDENGRFFVCRAYQMIAEAWFTIVLNRVIGNEQRHPIAVFYGYH